MNDPCRWCGETHLKGICQKIKAIEFEGDGVTVKRVEFLTPVDFHPMHIPFAQQPLRTIAQTYVPHISSLQLPDHLRPSLDVAVWSSNERPIQ